MKRHLSTVAVLLSLASPLSAQETPIRDTSLHLAPILFLTAGQFADGRSTTYKLAQGCGESNVKAYGTAPSASRVWLGKGLVIGAATVTTLILQKTGHQKAANWTGGSAGAIGFGAAGFNLMINCGAGR